MEIKDLLSQTHHLPNVPEVVRELIQTLNQPNVNYDEITAKVSKDQTLSLKVLRLVNSAHFGLSRKVSSIEEATVMLGMEKLKMLVIASGFANSTSDVEGLDTKKFWSESFLIATLAKWLAEHSNSIEADKAFTAGVIHNIGQLLLHLAQPNRAQAIQTLIDESHIHRSDAEMERLGFTTQDAGSALLAMWNFPEELCSAVQQYQKPLDYAEPQPLSATLNLAVYINEAIRDGKSEDDVIQQFPRDIATLAGLETDTLITLLPTAMTLESDMDGLTD